MKKNFKKIIALLSACMMMSGLAVSPASAAPAGANGQNFDTYAVGTQYNATGNTEFVTGSTRTNIYRQNMFNTITDTESEFYGLPTGEIVRDPAGADGDRALKVNLGTKGTNPVNLFAYLPDKLKGYDKNGAVNGIAVTEISFMADKRVNNTLVNLHSSAGNCYLFKLVSDGETGTKMINTRRNNAEVAKIEYNKWYNMQMIADTTGKTPADYYLKWYLNGELIDTLNYVDDLGWYTKKDDGTFSHVTLNTFQFVMNGNNISNMYFDDWKCYDVSGPTEFSINDISGAYAHGKEIELTADAYLGNDTNLDPINKVVWYDGDEEIGESTTYPYLVKYTPTGAGEHVITAEAWRAKDPYASVAADEASIIVEPNYDEQVIMGEDFENYDAETKPTEWADAQSGGTWKLINTNKLHEIKNVDMEHGKSMCIGTNSSRAIKAFPSKAVTEGTIKISGEYYLTETTGNNNTILFINDGADRNITRIHGTRLNNAFLGADNTLATLEQGRWYKIDIITTINDGQGYYNIYLDGKRLTQSAYEKGFTEIKKVDQVCFLTQFNDAPIYIDNLSVSKISYFDNAGFYCDGKKIAATQEMLGTTLTSKTAVISGNNFRNFLAVYDAATDKLLGCAEGTYDARTNVFTANIDADGMEIGTDGFYAKSFVWNGIMPTGEAAVLPAKIR